MNETPKKLAAEGLAFFGRMNAAISHDMKNVLAIINETASLLDELVELQQNGQIEPNPEKLRTLSRRIVNQVERGQNVISNMNAFAHSIDAPEREVDLAQVMRITVLRGEGFSTKVTGKAIFKHLLQGLEVWTSISTTHRDSSLWVRFQGLLLLCQQEVHGVRSTPQQRPGRQAPSGHLCKTAALLWPSQL